MQALEHIFFGILMVLFGLGVLGCLLTIPMAAFKFFSVLFEKNHADFPDERELPPDNLTPDAPR